MIDISSLIYLLIPIGLIQLGLQIYCIIDIYKKGVRNLNEIAWTIICLNLIGAIVYLLLGRKDEAE